MSRSFYISLLSLGRNNLRYICEDDQPRPNYERWELPYLCANFLSNLNYSAFEKWKLSYKLRQRKLVRIPNVKKTQLREKQKQKEVAYQGCWSSLDPFLLEQVNFKSWDYFPNIIFNIFNLLWMYFNLTSLRITQYVFLSHKLFSNVK